MGLGELSYQQRLRSLNLFSIRGRLLRADLIKTWKIFHGKCAIKPEDLFSPPNLASTRGHRFKIAHIRSRLLLRQKFFVVRIIPLWNSLPDDVVGTDSLDLFKAKLFDVLGDALFSSD